MFFTQNSISYDETTLIGNKYKTKMEQNKKKNSQIMEYIIKLIAIEKKWKLHGKQISAPRIFQDKYKKQTNIIIIVHTSILIIKLMNIIDKK